jgi:nucleoside-diphosphate-sugar epimerase
MSHPDPAPARRVAVLGAGYVGSAVAAAQAATGATVYAVRRTAMPRTDDGVRWLAGDVATGTVAGLPDALDAVVLALAPGRGADDYAATYVAGARGALALARRTGARLVYTSSTGVYGVQDGAWVTEASPRQGSGPSHDALCAAEDVLLGQDAVPVTVLRVAGIYGPGRDPAGRYRDPAALARGGDHWINLAHRDDIAAAIGHLLALAEAPRLLNCADGAPALAREVCAWLAARRGEDPASLAFTGTRAPARSNQRVSSAALQATGWRPRYASVREGLASLGH